VTQRRFEGYASQRNAALQSISYKYQWILILDADEQMPTGAHLQLFAEISQAPHAVSALRLQRRDYLYNTWLKHAQISPFYIRLVRHGKVHYHREINEVLLVDGVIADSAVLFNHYPFSKGITYWVAKHNQYSSMEAARWLEEHQQNIAFSLRDALYNKDFNQRRYHQKGLFYKMPGRPLLKWLYMVVGRRAFLDGRAGFAYATLQAIYEYFIVLKIKELLRK
jgi:glycosyltransferase involved in cell wall biosynthesis